MKNNVQVYSVRKHGVELHTLQAWINEVLNIPNLSYELNEALTYRELKEI